MLICPFNSFLMNKITSFIIGMLLTGMVSAQYGMNISYQFGLSGTDLYSSELKNSLAGVNARIYYQYDDYVRLNIGSGFWLIPYKNIAVDGVQTPVSDANLSVIPVTVGADFSFLDQRKDVKQKLIPYIGLDLGWALSQQSKSSLAPAASYNNFVIIPSFGMSYQLTDFVDLHLAFKENLLIYNFRGKNQYYEIFSLLGINAGINYKF